MSYKKILSIMVTGLLLFAIVLIYIRGAYLPIFSKQIKVGATYMTMNNDFYKTLNNELEKELNQKGDLLYSRDPELDETKQSQQIDTFVKEQVNVIVINPVKSDSILVLKSLKEAKKKGIKIIAVDTSLADKNLADTTIVSDNYQAGVLIAKDMMKVRKQANILLLEHKNALSAADRVQGFLDTIAKYSQYQVVSQRDTLGQTEESMYQVKQVLDQGTYFDTVMSLNDRSALGALAAIKNKPLSKKILVYGVDGSPEMKSMLATTNDIQGTVAQSPISMGKKVVDVIELIAENKPYQSRYLIPVTLINKKIIGKYDLTEWQ